MKNIVFIPNIDLNNGRNNSYHYSVKSWEEWCRKNNVQLVEWKDPITDTNYLKVTLQRYWVHDILEFNGFEYDQVLVIDADTIIHPDTPNFFNETDGKFCVVVNNGCYEWTTRSIEQWGNALFPTQPKVKPWEYFNGGFQITSKSHRDFYNKVKDFYVQNVDYINKLASEIKAGTDQTIINYLTKLYGIETKILPECYNLQDLFRKNLLHIPGHSWFPDELIFTKAGWIYHFNAIPQNPRHVDYWLERTYKELCGKAEVSPIQPISLDYFLNMEVANGGESKQILNLNGKLKTVKDIVDYWKKAPKPELKPSNWQYYNCMIAGFRKNVADHHAMGWDKMTAEYYESLEKMSDEEIEEYLKNNPMDFDNGFIKHSYHRAYAMIGRLIRGEKYIPFYMHTERIYDKPTKLDGVHRVKPLTSNLSRLRELDALGIPKSEYCLAQSSILAVMGIRESDDLDIIISPKLRKMDISFPQGVEVFPENYSKFDLFGAEGDQDLIDNYCITIDGYRFLEPRFYFARKNVNKTERDVSDMVRVREFFDRNAHKGYPFNFEFYKWGVTLVDRVQLKNLDLSQYTLIKDKYDRVVDGVNHGRKLYYDPKTKEYIKIFNPNYCRLNNLRTALANGVLNGIAPALNKLIYQDSEVIGYICQGGEVVADNDFEFDKIPHSFVKTVLKNCKHRGYYYYDFVPQNVVKLQNGQYSLIDLESFYSPEAEEEMNQHNARFKPEKLVSQIESV